MPRSSTDLHHLCLKLCKLRGNNLSYFQEYSNRRVNTLRPQKNS